MTNKQQIEFLIRASENRIAEGEKRLLDAVNSIAREAANAKQWVEDKRGTSSLGCFASNCAMRAMEMATIAAEVEQHKAVRQSMVTMLEMLPG
jgi:hypothetical protein